MEFPTIAEWRKYSQYEQESFDQHELINEAIARIDELETELDELRFEVLESEETQ